MVFLATTRRAYEACIALDSGAALWVSAGILSLHEIRDLRDRGYRITDFSYVINGSDPES
jgi:hypothetical protein